MMNKYFINSALYNQAVQCLCQKFGVDPYHHKITLEKVEDGFMTFKVKGKDETLFLDVKF